jgi:hypothetical protein
MNNELYGQAEALLQDSRDTIVVSKWSSDLPLAQVLALQSIATSLIALQDVLVVPGIPPGPGSS